MLSQSYPARIISLMQWIFDSLGKIFNDNSHQMLQKVYIYFKEIEIIQVNLSSNSRNADLLSKSLLKDEIS